MTHAVRDVAKRTAGALLAVFAFLMSMLVSAGPAQAAEPLPGGKANWVVSVGHMDLASKNNYRNWVRLGYYVFNTDGTVTTNYWYWHQRDQPVRVDAMTADCGGSVPTCAVRTVDGYKGDPTGGYQGTFGYASDGRLAVTWTKNAAGTPLTDPLTEYWNVEAGLAGGGAARITSPTFYGPYSKPDNWNVTIPAPGEFSSYTANFGVGYGSNASLGRESRATMSQLITDPRYNAQPYKGAFVVAKASSADPKTRVGIVGREGSGGAWSFGAAANPWKQCNGSPCMGWLQPGTSCAGTDKDRARYIAEIGGGRRNTEEYWCQSLAQGQPCYKYNSHPRPMLQVIDDSGKFQGWVGVEAFTHVSTSTGLPDSGWVEGYWGIFDMVSAALEPKLEG
ncbi:hypothetical protein HRW23_02100 [Streptomyces lunaelactis]|uniref:hypothetical protein n=1 Tax=Streptomyces lunaelactis TaxID=1535768 RepID=UPI001585BF52|nr:hypothetical protein [Streptomyces lunaelactis]NUK12718.1 hypothetical protein [Streptomyces lunaelactis]NUK20668.1 hypothetical protein [Streptomyces lunaelactis]NUK28104.1 hypothetical protein [Streptomyces lunaelactis]NUK39034.1 hypothetical protein [Streptomyces lunaelactis]NUK45538.1 hypothetical protein [Streptomyces lunaelactis]